MAKKKKQAEQPDESMLDALGVDDELAKVVVDEPQEESATIPGLDNALAARISDRITALQDSFHRKLERSEKKLHDAVARLDKHTDTVREVQKRLGQAKSEMVDMGEKHRKSMRMIDEACARISNSNSQALKLAQNLEKRLDIIVTPDAAVAPLIADIKRVSKEVAALSDSTSRRLERLRNELTQWVPEYRRKGRAPQS